MQKTMSRKPFANANNTLPKPVAALGIAPVDFLDSIPSAPSPNERKHAAKNKNSATRATTASSAKKSSEKNNNTAPAIVEVSSPMSQAQPKSYSSALIGNKKVVSASSAPPKVVASRHTVVAATKDQKQPLPQQIDEQVEEAWDDFVISPATTNGSSATREGEYTHHGQQQQGSPYPMGEEGECEAVLDDVQLVLDQQNSSSSYPSSVHHNSVERSSRSGSENLSFQYSQNNNALNQYGNSSALVHSSAVTAFQKSMMSSGLSMCDGGLSSVSSCHSHHSVDLRDEEIEVSTTGNTSATPTPRPSVVDFMSAAPSSMYGELPLVAPLQHQCFLQQTQVAVPSTCHSCHKLCSRPFCSKRCEWFSQCKCPQCGRQRDPSNIFCSIVCASQATQANWCVACGVRQIIAGGTHCSYECANSLAASHAVVIPRRKAVITNQRRQHLFLSPDDKQYQSIARQFEMALRAELGSGHAICSIIKICPDTLRKKSFLNYRSLVEQQLSMNRAPKYGHGGEGNEHKRYFPVSCSCSLNLPSLSSNRNGGNPSIATPCNNLDCEACSILNYGFRLAYTGAASHYCTTTINCAIPWTEQNMNSGLRAVVLSRAVIGNPVIVSSSNEVCLPQDPTLNHCTIVSNGEPGLDGTYLFHDDAVDPQFLVLFV